MYKPDDEEIVQAAPEAAPEAEAADSEIPVDAPPEETEEAPVEEDKE
jgi:hypothetical protein